MKWKCRKVNVLPIDHALLFKLKGVAIVETVHKTVLPSLVCVLFSDNNFRDWLPYTIIFLVAQLVSSWCVD